MADTENFWLIFIISDYVYVRFEYMVKAASQFVKELNEHEANL